MLALQDLTEGSSTVIFPDLIHLASWVCPNAYLEIRQRCGYPKEVDLQTFAWRCSMPLRDVSLRMATSKEPYLIG